MTLPRTRTTEHQWVAFGPNYSDKLCSHCLRTAQKATANCQGDRKHVRIVAFIGAAGSGKDTASSVLWRKGWAHLKFADPLKDMLRALHNYIGTSSEQQREYLEGGAKEEPIAKLSGATTRKMMQTLGTDWGRMRISSDLWAKILRARIEYLTLRVDCLSTHNFVISDMRFKNEVKALKGYNPLIIRVERPGLVQALEHISEREHYDIKADITLVNDGSEEAFRAKVEALLGKA